MVKYHKNQTSAETINEAEKIAKATQRPGQSKEQTKLIAQGIQKGIELYKKQHKAKLREQDKRQKRQKRAATSEAPDGSIEAGDESLIKYRQHPLPWILLLLSWLLMGVYLVYSPTGGL